MSTSLIALLFFAAFVTAVAALLLFVHQLGAWFRQRKRDKDPAIRLRRIQRPRETEQKGLTAKFDRWFINMVRDSGLYWDPFAATLLLVLGGAVAGSAAYLWRENIAVAVLGVVLGMAVPLLSLMYKQKKHVRQLQEQLPASLEMLSRSVRAGQSLDQAIKLVGQQSPEPLAREFRWCGMQLEMGLSMASVMQLLVERVRLHDVRIFTTTLTVHRQTGGNVAKVLARLADVVRNRLSYRRQLRVATAAGRASAILVGIIGPLVFLFFLAFRTEYLDAMLQQPLGQSLLVGAAALEVVGLIWTWRLLKPTY
jgi:tight adherence protein B